VAEIVAENAVMTLVVATHNAGKVTEIRAALDDLPLSIVTPAEVLGDRAPDIAETGETFLENATIKARETSAATYLVALADDSGLEVDALGGKPGVRSARYARDGATDAENNAALLAALADVEDRTARFRCVMVLWDPFGAAAPVTAEGSCEGVVLRAARGTAGFGYDPLFVVDGLDRSFAELTPAEKLSLSHRGKALAAMRVHIEELVPARVREAERVLAKEPSSGAGSAP
jgi:XTP/dITP diphosphohydrolase